MNLHIRAYEIPNNNITYDRGWPISEKENQFIDLIDKTNGLFTSLEINPQGRIIVSRWTIDPKTEDTIGDPLVTNLVL